MIGKRPKKSEKINIYKCNNCAGFFDNPRKIEENEIGCDFCGHDDITKKEEYYFFEDE